MYGRETHVQTVFIMNSPFIISWVEIRAAKGIVTVNDQKKIGLFNFEISRKKTAIYLHFKDKSTAKNFLSTLSKKLSKRYECRIFSDYQMSKSEVRAKDLNVPFTQRQREEVYYINQ